jgi:hypothetical protein
MMTRHQPRMPMVALLLFIFISSSSIFVIVTAISITLDLDTTSCIGYPIFDYLDTTTTCTRGDNVGESSSPKCHFGDIVTITGTVEALYNFTSNIELSSKTCSRIWGTNNCPAAENVGSLCSTTSTTNNWLIPIENQTCGWPGLYGISGTESIPYSDLHDSLSWMVSVTISIVDDDDDCVDYDTLQQYHYSKSNNEDNEQQEEESSNFWFMGAIFGTAFGAILVRKNVHRRCAGIDEDGNYIYFDDENTIDERSTAADDRSTVTDDRSIMTTDESCVSIDEEMMRTYEMMMRTNKKLRKGRR